MMAKALGISVSSVQRIWRAHGLQPHRVRQFKLSCDPQFAAKLRDVVGLLSIRRRMRSSCPIPQTRFHRRAYGGVAPLAAIYAPGRCLFRRDRSFHHAADA
jgi:hypothetical protein